MEGLKRSSRCTAAYRHWMRSGCAGRAGQCDDGAARCARRVGGISDLRKAAGEGEPPEKECTPDKVPTTGQSAVSIFHVNNREYSCLKVALWGVLMLKSWD